MTAGLPSDAEPDAWAFQVDELWHKWKDPESNSAVKVACGGLAGMGIPTASLGPAAVAATVCLLNVALKVGIEAGCEGGKQEGDNPDGTAETKPEQQSQGQ